MKQLEFSDKLRALLGPLEIGDLEIVGNILRFRIKVDGETKYGSFKFNQLDDDLLAEIARNVKPLPGCPHCGYRHPPDGVCI